MRIVTRLPGLRRNTPGWVARAVRFTMAPILTRRKIGNFYNLHPLAVNNRTHIQALVDKK
jgi:hypothetical protein